MLLRILPGSALRTSWIVVLATAALLPPARGGEPHSTTITIPLVSRVPQLEDVLEGVSRLGGVEIADFRQRQPNDGAPVSQPTTAWLSYDENNLYVLFLCREEPGKVRAHMSRRESVSNDDLVGISLDTFHDGRRAYMFYSNALGVQLDGITTEGQSDDYTFDTVWRSEGRLVPGGYAVRFAIPFKSLRFPAGPGRAWGIALTRVIRRNQEYSTWPRITDRVEAYVPQFAAAEGLDTPHSGRNIQLVPYGFLERERFLHDGRMLRENEIRGGLDAKAVLHDSLTLDVTLNPDFSQVESDEPQVTINQRYEVFFPEKRPFFLDNAGYFQTPETLFFSRRVVDPQFGARLTGKIGNWALGLLAMDDRAPGLAPGAEEAPGASGRARIGVVRIQRDFGHESNAGFLVTSDRVGQSYNSVYSADGRYKVNANWILTGQVMRSTTRDGESGAQQTGAAYFAEVRHAGRHFSYYSQYRDRSPEFNAALGYIPRVDLRRVKNYAAYQWRPEAGFLVSYGPSMYATLDWDYSGRLQGWSVETPLTFNFKGPSSVGLSREESYEWYAGRGFRKYGNSFSAATERWKWLGVSGSFRNGTDINYYPGPALLPSTARSQDATLMATFRPGPRVRLEESYVYSRLAGRVTIFDNHIVRSKLNYQFTRSLSARVILDYNAVLPNEQLVNLERAKRVNVDFLATYMPHPGTAVYFGYGDRYENLLPPDWQRTRVPGYSTGRQVFVKFSYFIRL
jgi:hypothetical protein